MIFLKFSSQAMLPKLIRQHLSAWILAALAVIASSLLGAFHQQIYDAVATKLGIQLLLQALLLATLIAVYLSFELYDAKSKNPRRYLRWVEKGCIGKRYKENEGSLREIQFS